MSAHEHPYGARDKKGENRLNDKDLREVLDSEAFQKGRMSIVVDQDAADPHGQLDGRDPKQELHFMRVNPEDPLEEKKRLLPLE